MQETGKSTALKGQGIHVAGKQRREPLDGLYCYNMSLRYEGPSGHLITDL